MSLGHRVEELYPRAVPSTLLLQSRRAMIHCQWWPWAAHGVPDSNTIL